MISCLNEGCFYNVNEKAAVLMWSEKKHIV